MRNYTFIILLLTLLQACNNEEKPVDADRVNVQSDTTGFQFQSNIKYSHCFKINQFDGFKQVVVFDMWSDDTLTNCIVYPKGYSEPENKLNAEIVLPVPVDNIAILSSTHIGFLDLLNELNSVIGVSNIEHVFNKRLKAKVEEGTVSQIGLQMESNTESILALSPELLMKTGHDQVRNNDKRLLSTGIPLVYNIEWMEKDLLGRAEWIKFVSVFFCKEKIADSIFNTIEKEYDRVKTLAQSTAHKPTILAGYNFKGTWYAPGGSSYKAKLFADAGGDYYFKQDTTLGSLPLSFETVMEHQLDADVWMISSSQSLSELEAMDERYKLFKSFQIGNVYSPSKRQSKTGGNDFWESGISNPDLILKDVIKILHPNLLPDYEMVYYKKLTVE